MKKRCFHAILLALIPQLVCVEICLSDGDDSHARAKRSYCIQVLKNYEVCWLGPGSAKDTGRFVLARRLNFSSRQFVVDPILHYAVCGEVLWGTQPNCYFIFDTAKQSNNEPEPIFFSDRNKWEETLNKRGISGNIPLLNPDDVAATRPPSELYPEDYLFMKGAIGLSDPDWRFVVDLITWAACFVLGSIRKNVTPGLLFSGSIGFVANIMEMLFMGGGGPSAFVGMLGRPLICCGVFGLGRAMQKLIFKFTQRSSMTKTG